MCATSCVTLGDKLALLWHGGSWSLSPSRPRERAVSGAAAYQRAVRGSAGAGAGEQVWPGQEHLGRSL